MLYFILWGFKEKMQVLSDVANWKWQFNLSERLRDYPFSIMAMINTTQSKTMTTNLRRKIGCSTNWRSIVKYICLLIYESMLPIFLVTVIK